MSCKKSSANRHCAGVGPIPSSRAGFTLPELLVAIGISALFLVCLSVLLVNSIKSYSSQKKILEMRKNSEDVLLTLSDCFFQAGVDLPKDEQIITLNGPKDITILINEKGIYTMYKSPLVASYQVPVRSGKAFVNAVQLKKRENSSTPVFSACYINSGYQQDNFTDGVDTIGDSVCLTTQEAFYTGDELYSYTRYHILHDSIGKKLYIAKQPLGETCDSSLQAEHIEDLKILFFKADGTAANSWETMKQCSLWVSVSASIPGQRGTLAQGKKFIMRNKLL